MSVLPDTNKHASIKIPHGPDDMLLQELISFVRFKLLEMSLGSHADIVPYMSSAVEVAEAPP